MFQIENIREKKVDIFNEIYLNEGKIKLIEAIAEGLGKRTYFTIDEEGVIKRKDLNMAYSLITTLNKDNYKDLIKKIVEEMVDLTQREKIKKIERLSKYTLENLLKNFNKILASGDRNFGLKYGKELFLRDKELFFERLFDYVLLENIESKKSIMAWSLYDLLKDEEFSDEVFYVGMSYIFQKKSDFKNYERVSSLELEELNKEKLLNSIDENSLLEVVCYKNMLNKFSYKKENIYLNILKEALN